MSCISFLQRIGLLPRIFRSEVEEAQTEDVLRTRIENAKAIDVASATTQRNQQSNGRLRESIRRVKSSSAFAEFETSLKARGGFHRDR